LFQSFGLLEQGSAAEFGGDAAAGASGHGGFEMCLQQRQDLCRWGQNGDKGAKQHGQGLFLAFRLFGGGKGNGDGIPELYPWDCTVTQPETGRHPVQQGCAGLVLAEVNRPQGKGLGTEHPIHRSRVGGGAVVCRLFPWGAVVFLVLAQSLPWISRTPWLL
jgi:hypothetical protein